MLVMSTIVSHVVGLDVPFSLYLTISNISKVFNVCLVLSHFIVYKQTKVNMSYRTKKIMNCSCLEI